jgi:hypothetical protein
MFFFVLAFIFLAIGLAFLIFGFESLPRSAIRPALRGIRLAAHRSGSFFHVSSEIQAKRDALLKEKEREFELQKESEREAQHEQALMLMMSAAMDSFLILCDEMVKLYDR